MLSREGRRVENRCALRHAVSSVIVVLLLIHFHGMLFILSCHCSAHVSIPYAMSDVYSLLEPLHNVRTMMSEHVCCARARKRGGARAQGYKGKSGVGGCGAHFPDLEIPHTKSVVDRTVGGA